MRPRFVLALMALAPAAIILAMAAADFSFAPPAAAHSKEANSSPENGTTVAKGLSRITLAFSGVVRVTRVTVENSQTSATVEPTPAGSGGFAKSYPIEVPPLGAGSYAVKWTAVAKDGHVMSGTLSFIVAD